MVNSIIAKSDGTSRYKFLVWLCDADGSNRHRTPQAVSVTANDYSEARSKAVTLAKSRATRHNDRAYAVRQPTTAEIKTAASGNWIRTGAKGQKAGYSGIKGVGAKLGKGTRTDEDRLNEYIIERSDELFEKYDDDYLLVLHLDVIKKIGDKFVLFSRDGSKKLGEYDSYDEAKKREKQIILFKTMAKNPELRAKLKSDAGLSLNTLEDKLSKASIITEEDLVNILGDDNE